MVGDQAGWVEFPRLSGLRLHLRRDRIHRLVGDGDSMRPEPFEVDLNFLTVHTDVRNHTARPTTSRPNWNGAGTPTASMAISMPRPTVSNSAASIALVRRVAHQSCEMFANWEPAPTSGEVIVGAGD